MRSGRFGLARAFWVVATTTTTTTMTTTTKSGPAEVQLAVLFGDADTIIMVSLLCDFEAALELECGRAVVVLVCSDTLMMAGRGSGCRLSRRVV
jgi:hypothetical protein